MFVVAQWFLLGVFTADTVGLCAQSKGQQTERKPKCIGLQCIDTPSHYVCENFH